MGLDSVELLMRVEDEFDIEVPDAEAAEIFTVGDLYHCILRKYEAKTVNSGDDANEPTWQKLCDILVDQTGVSPENIAPSARIVKDLGID